MLADFEEAGDDDVLRKVAKDLKSKGITEAQSRRQDDGIAGRSRGADPGRQVTRRAISPPALRSPAACARARPSTRPGAPWPRRSSPRLSRARVLPAVVLDQQHGLWDTASTERRIGAVRHAGAAPVVRMPLGDFAVRQPRARFRRRGSHRADDQHGERGAPLRRCDEISAGRRTKLGPARARPRSPASPN